MCIVYENWDTLLINLRKVCSPFIFLNAFSDGKYKTLFHSLFYIFLRKVFFKVDKSFAFQGIAWGLKGRKSKVVKGIKGRSDLPIK